MKFSLYTIVVLLFSFSLQAQVGIGTTTPQGALDIVSANDGLLIPRVALTDLTTLTVLTPTASEIVYNTTGNAFVTPGFYYLNAAANTWIRLGGATGWLTDGNNDITAASFLGTVTGTNFDIAFRRNGAVAGRIGTTSTAFGVGALANAAGSNSTAIGNNALAVSTGNNNVAIGQNALQDSNTTAQWNTAVGVNALSNINSNAAQDNVAVGYSAMGNGTGNISGVVAIGSRALFNSTVSNATAIGFNALQGQVGGGLGNTGVGYRVLNDNTTGDFNTVLGNEAGFGATGSNNTLIGYLAGRYPGGSSDNTFVGFQTGMSTTGSNNIILGSNAQVPNAAGNNQLSIGNWIYGNAGNIGIGVTVPTEKLEVNGKMTATNIDVTGNIGIGVVAPTDKLEVNGKIRAVDVNFSGLPVAADEAAAIALGTIATGDLYQTVTGEIRIKL